MRSIVITLAAVAALAATIVVPTPPPVVAALGDWDIHAPWGVSGLAEDRQTVNKVYIYDIERLGNRIYVAGAFEKVFHRSQPSNVFDQPFLAAFDAVSGAYIPEFAPRLNHPVYALLEHPETGSLLVGGEFTEVNGTPRRGLVALDPGSGATDASFRAEVIGPRARRAVVRGLDTNGTEIYVGGGFVGLNDGALLYSAQSLGRVGLDGAVDPSFRPTVQGGGVWTLALSTDQQRLLFGGLFDTVDGEPRPAMAMVTVDGTLTDGFSDWRTVYRYCHRLYTGCGLVYDLDVDNGQVLISAAEHVSTLADDTTGATIWQRAEPHDTQAGLMDGDKVWLTRHGRAWDTGLWYQVDRATGEVTSELVGALPSSGPGGFAFEHGNNGCIWTGGTLGAADIATDNTSNLVAIGHLAMFCPAGTPVPVADPQLDDMTPTRGRVTAQGHDWFTVSYVPAPAASRHDIYVDGVYVGTDANTGRFSAYGTLSNHAHVVEVQPIAPDGRRGTSLQVTATTRSLGTVTMSSAYNAQVYPGSALVDADLQSLAITARAFEPWMDVDFGAELTIGSVTLWNRPALPERANGIWVMLSDQPFAAGSTLAEDLAMADAAAQVAVLPVEAYEVPVAGTGRYLRLRLPTDTWLQLADMGAHVSGDTPPGGAFAIDGMDDPEPPAGDPLSCAVSAAETGATVSWTGHTQADAIIVYRSVDGNEIWWRGRVDAPGAEFVDSIVPGVRYRYEIRERFGNVNAAPIDCGEVVPPVPDTGLLTCSLTTAGSQVTVNWTGPTDADAVIVYRTPDGGNTWWRGRVDSPGTSFADTLGNTSYDYEIRERIGNVNAEPIGCGRTP